MSVLMPIPTSIAGQPALSPWEIEIVERCRHFERRVDGVIGIVGIGETARQESP